MTTRASDHHLNTYDAMILRLTLLFLAAALTSCSLYPMGHSRNGDYYGGQGATVSQRLFVPKDLRREEPLF